MIGLTGGIGSGKTAVTNALRAHGYFVVDADEVSRELFGLGTAGEKELLSLFPECGNGGTLDRAALRMLISRDENARSKLNAATHPAIIKRVKELAAGAPSQPVILCAPLLFESGLSELCDITVAVFCPRRERVERLIRRDGISKPQAEAIIDAQIDDAERCTLADYVLPNDGNIALLASHALDLFNYLSHRSNN